MRTGSPCSSVALIVWVVAASAAGSAAADPLDRHVLRARALMQELRAESRRDTARIAEAYERADGALLTREALRRAIEHGAIAQMPLDTAPFNLRLRTDGAHPIGEFDRLHQHLYTAAHPAALGLLIQIASQVTSASLDVTSLVRHADYQRRLGASNPNARTSLAMHTYGLAFDISILHVPISTAREIRDVLRRLRDRGDLFFVAEVRQLVFHVVVAPQRAPYHAAMFDGLAPTPPHAWIAAPLPAEVAIDRQRTRLLAFQVDHERSFDMAFLVPPFVAAAGTMTALLRRSRRPRARRLRLDARSWDRCPRAPR